MARRAPMNEDQLKSWVLRQLGAPRLSLELHPCHLDDIYEDAIDWFLAYKGIEKIHFFDVFSGQPSYTPPDDADTIINVIEPSPPYNLGIVFSPYTVIDEKVPYDVFAAPEAVGIYSSYAQALQYSDMASKVLSADFDWVWDEQRKLLILTPVPRTNARAAMVYKSNCLTPEDLSFHDHELFKRYMLARAKMILGRIRNRYNDEFLSADGPKQNDGSRLLDEAQEEMDALTEEIKNSGYPMLFVTG
jgi:hypothetical protein